jgi:hypothetical protein
LYEPYETQINRWAAGPKTTARQRLDEALENLDAFAGTVMPAVRAAAAERGHR